MSVESEVVALLDHVEATFGPVDLFCANAGVGIGTDLETSDADWRTALDVNFMAHLYAARALVPGWVERGDGYFVTTASAAGLLTQIGSGPYAVSKHAAVAFAEWLAVTYGDQGVKVSCLCPMGVNTAMLNPPGGGGRRHRGAGRQRGEGGRRRARAGRRSPRSSCRPSPTRRFLILPHPEVLTFFQRKASDYDRWLAGMRRLQARVAAG